jgi:dsRNA-specific ribonuclease
MTPATSLAFQWSNSEQDDTAPQAAALGARAVERLVGTLGRALGGGRDGGSAQQAAATIASASGSGSSSSSSSSSTAGSHTEYYSARYGVGGLRPELPMLAVSDAGPQKALQLLGDLLKPPALQQTQRRPTQQPGGGGDGQRGWLHARPADLITPDAASAAADFSSSSTISQRRRTDDSSGGGGSSPGASPPPPAAAAAAPSRARITARYLPLELCWCLPLSAAAWQQAAQLPAYMHRVNALLRLQGMAGQLQDRLGVQVLAPGAALPPQQQQQQQQQRRQGRGAGSAGSVCRIAPALLAAALTGPGAREAYDMEGLEFMGDVVLKFLATNYLLQVCVGCCCGARAGACPLQGCCVGAAGMHASICCGCRRHQATAGCCLLPASVAKACLRACCLARRALAAMLLQAQPNSNEGELSVAKARLVRNVALAAAAQAPQLALPAHLLLVPYSAARYTPTGALARGSGSGGGGGSGGSGSSVPLRLLAQPQQAAMQGKRLADAVEALIGGVYLTAAAAAATAAAADGDAPVSQAGLQAAARFCDAAGVLPSGVAGHYGGLSPTDAVPASVRRAPRTSPTTPHAPSHFTRPPRCRRLRCHRLQALHSRLPGTPRPRQHQQQRRRHQAGGTGRRAAAQPGAAAGWVHLSAAPAAAAGAHARLTL